MTLRADQMQLSLYGKVFSNSTDVAMLMMAGGGVWRLAPASVGAGTGRLRHTRNAVEDAVHHEGRFYSITYSGQVETWVERDADAPDVFLSVVIAPRLLLPADTDHQKYLVAAPGGPLMVVLKETTGRRMSPSFKVQVIDAGREGWKETDDIGDIALFIVLNGSLCMSTREHRG
uniref:KIB1-4 beta-propeller domain-containing protein n=1 Tax=Aegilops tauschii TaxID=37682 RepID=M8BF52_AEGTA